MRIPFFTASKTEQLVKRVNDLETQLVKANEKAHYRGFDTFQVRQGVLSPLDPSATQRRATLSNAQLRNCYYTNPVIRAIINGITRIVSEAPWEIVSNKEDNPASDNLIQEIHNFYENPNDNDESFSYINSQMVQDLLIMDAGVIENVFNRSGNKLLRFRALDADPFSIIRNEVGIVTGYRQQNFVQPEQYVDFGPDEIIYFILYPSTNTPYGSPVMEALINEMSAVLYHSKFIRESFDSNQIPQGILDLGDIGDIAYEKAREEFKADQGGRATHKMKVINSGRQQTSRGVNWIELKHSPRELMIDQIMIAVHKLIFMAFGITPTVMGSVEDVNRATALVQENITKSALINPIIERLEYFYNREQVWRHLDPTESARLSIGKQDETTPEFNLELVKTLVPLGGMPIDEARGLFNLDPLKDGLGEHPIIINATGTKKLEDIINPPEPEPMANNPFEKPQIPEMTGQEEEPEQDNEPDVEQVLNNMGMTCKNNDGLRIQLQYITKAKPVTINIYQSLVTQNQIKRDFDRAYKSIEKRFIPAYIKALKGNGNRKQVIDSAVSQIYGRMRNISKQRYRDSFDDGLDRARMLRKIDVKENSVNNEYDKLVESQVIKWIKESLIEGKEGFIAKMERIAKEYKERYGSKKFVNKAEMIEEDEWLEDTVTHGAAVIGARLPGYAAKAETMAYKGWIWGLMHAEEPVEEEKVWWTTTSGKECPDCQALSGQSFKISNVPQVPRDGNTVCHDNCYCVLELSTSKPAGSLAGVGL